ncbi:hypothetical protein [Serratia marcescens]|uniref:hypothetical protein n=1 Tax=Serratia marcescens TaxID=615 RepID=UPI0006ECEF28|nr:hypothetical protein [Serratia marcescens]ALL39861.1 hypothetical protein AR325_23925 [Serratia marcescens]PHI54222.1 hypothetical protein B9T65_00145 [Serratia marcescens]UJA53664.1 hypothetical protein L1F17_22325 [Serratia marcescens]
MAENSKAVSTAVTPVSEAVQEQIHFDTLWATTQSALALYSGKSWSAQGEDDPGVTLLQALTYGVSDISYRHTLPLQDLLTEKNGGERNTAISLDHKGNLFAPEFGPEWALTSSPVTMEDYRRAILDLVPLVKGDEKKDDKTLENRFCFRDVQIAPLPHEQSYGYVNDSDKYVFRFASSAPLAGSERLYHVAGHYQLWVTLTPGMTAAAARQALQHFLKNHRNLCEWEITSPCVVPVTVQTPYFQLVLEDDQLLNGDAIAKAVAQAIFAMNQVLLPIPERKRAGERLKQGESAEQIYAGPRLTHGWISHLPPERVMSGETSAKEVKVHALSVAAVSRVPGIRAVNNWKEKRAEKEELVDITVIANAAGQQTQLWFKDDGLLEPGFHQRIELYRHGQLVSNTLWDIDSVVKEYQRLNAVAFRADVEPARKIPNGRTRNPGFYRTVGASLPPVYGLQQAADRVADDKDAGRLLQFLRPFEQWLANSADQLKKLPRLLAFDGRDPNASVWGGADWPSRQDDALAREQTQKVFDSTVLADIQQIVSTQSKDVEKELTILDHLLGYFGEQRASRVLNLNKKDASEFLPVQQGALRQVTRLAYERAAISISKVSALQRKIAARLGIGERLFDEDLQREGGFPDKLPFYVIEHQELLPIAPKPESFSTPWPKKQTVASFEHVGEVLTLTLHGVADALASGMLIELQRADKPDLLLSSLVIHTVKGNSVSIQLEQHARLRSSMPMLMQKGVHWKWQMSQVWLKRVVYDLSLPKETIREQKEVVLNVSPSFPIELVEKTRFVLRPKARWMIWPTKNDLVGHDGAAKKPDVVVEVVKADPLKGAVTVKWIGNLKKEGIQNPEGNPTVVPVNKEEIKDLKPSPPNWSEVQDAQYPYAWSVLCTRESFAFTLSLVLDRSWLKDSQTPEELDRWITQIAREEMPSHLNLQVHWLNESNFDNFAKTYRTWQEGGRPVGDQSYELLRLLGIGERPVDGRGGIGFAQVASQSKSQIIEERLQKEQGDAERDRLLQQEAVVYVRDAGMKF